MSIFSGVERTPLSGSLGAVSASRAIGARRLRGSGMVIILGLLGVGLIAWSVGLGGQGAHSAAQAARSAAARHASAPQPSSAAQRRARAAYGKLPLGFEANRGQTDPRVKFLAHGAGYTLWLTPDEAVLSLTKVSGAVHAGNRGARSAAKRSAVAVVRMRMLGVNPNPKLTGAAPLAGATNYFTGKDPSKWKTGVQSFGRVRYQDIYPGIDLLYHGSQGRLEYDYRLAPGADPDRIALAISGARRVGLDGKGDLLLRTNAGTLRQERPVAYQLLGGHRRNVSARFVLGRDRVGFSLGRYDRARPLVIDPELVYSTYFGGSASPDGGYEQGEGIATDAAGNTYVTGSTHSSDFPTQGPLQGQPGGADDGFVAKLDPSGALVYSTYLGGSDFDIGRAIAVDPAGAAYVAGETRSTDFPTTAGAYDRTCGGVSGTCGFYTGANVFLAKLAPDGASLSYSTYLGSSGWDRPEGVAVDSAGAAYVAGQTRSATGQASDFPTKDPIQPFVGSGPYVDDGFVTKVNPSGSGLDYSTALGGTGEDYVNDIAVDAAGSAYVTGLTNSADFPTTAGAYDISPQGGQDAFAAKLNPAGSALDYSTFLGGSGSDTGTGIAVGHGASDTGDAYVYGSTDSANFPTTPGAYDRKLNGASDAFVTRLSADGGSLGYSTLIGGSGFEPAAYQNQNPFDRQPKLAVDCTGSAYVTGTTDNTSFPQVRPVVAAPAGSYYYAFVAKLVSNGSALSWSTLLSDQSYSIGVDIAVDPAGATYFTGAATGGSYPVRNALQTSPGALAYSTPVITKFSPDAGQPSCVPAAGNPGGGTGSAGGGTGPLITTSTTGTSPSAVAVTLPASGVSTSSVRLNGRVDTGGRAGAWQFQFGTSSSYNKGTPLQTIAAGTRSISVSWVINKLSADTVYHYRMVLLTGAGTAASPLVRTYGSDLSFRTGHIGRLLLLGHRLRVSGGRVLATLECASRLACHGRFSITTRARLAGSHALATIDCTAPKTTFFRINAHATKTVSATVPGGCLSLLGSHHQLRAKFTSRPRTAQQGIIKRIILLLGMG